MGVDGLWKLLDQVNCGNPVSLESLENIILAIDCSIWLNQIIKGTRNEDDHLLNVFRRICKLMHYKIKPVFVFDGGVPELKRRTILSRKNRSEDLVNRQLNKLKTFVKNKHNIELDLEGSNLRSTKLRDFRDDDKLFYLNDDLNCELSDEEDSDDYEANQNDIYLNGKQIKLESTSNPVLKTIKHQTVTDIDTNSEQFKSLPPELRHEILIEIKEIKKYNFGERRVQAPEDMGDYSNYQIGKLIKNYDIQKEIEKTREEMIGLRGTNLDQKFKEEYEKYISTRIASDEHSNLLFTKKKAPEIKPSIIKSIEKPKKAYNPTIYGTVEEFDYDLTEELDPEAKKGLINDRMIQKIEIKKEINEDSSTDDSDFVEVHDDITEDCIDNLDFDLSEIHPVLLLNEKKVMQGPDQPQIDKKSEQLKSPNKRTSVSSQESKNKRTLLLSNFEKMKSPEKTSIVISDSNVDKTIVLDETIADDIPEKVTKKVNESEILSCSDDDLFEGETKFEEDLKKFLDKIEDDEKVKTDELKQVDEMKNEIIHKESKVEEIESIKPSTSTETIKSPTKNTTIDLSVDFLENKNEDEIMNLVDNDIINKLTEPKASSSQSNTPKKELKFVQLKPPTDDQLVDNNKIKLKKQDLSESLQLVRDIKKVRRQTNTIETSLIEDTKEMLTLFGIPYVISPMEAEAQCAILEQLNLTKGTITDDGDVWLFGAKTVYKNFYNQSKFVVKYTYKEIVDRLKLTREDLICFAMLTGSDYTTGIRGVGPVTATEIIKEFKDDQIKTLKNFKQFWQDNKNKKPTKMNKTREKFLKYELPKSFPNQKVFDAYINPEVDHSSDKFKFGKPDLDLLRQYTSEKFNWSRERQDKELLPLFKRINDSSTQTKISSFFQVIAHKKEPDKIESKRLQKVLDNKTDSNDKSNGSKNKIKNSKTGRKTKAIKKIETKNDVGNQKLITLDQRIKNQRKKINSNSTNTLNDKNTTISKYFVNTVNKRPTSTLTKDSEQELICLSESSD